MKLKAGDVTKVIPREYRRGFELMNHDDFDKPDKKRLSPWERFRVALYTWESKQSPETLRYLAGSKPEYVIHQCNRKYEFRYVVRYKDASNDLKHAIVPASIAKLCPIKMHEHLDF